MNTTFTDADFEALMTLLLPFDEQFPDLRIHLDRLFYHLEPLVSGEPEQMTFGEFHRLGIEARAKRTCTGQLRTAFQLGLIGLVLSESLKRVAYRFPAIDIYADRVMYEIIRRLEEMENAGKFESLATNGLSFRAFHHDHRMRRRVFNSQVKGVG